MKIVTIKVSFDEQKKAALVQFLGKKGLTLEDEVAGFLQKLYEKTVPAQVKEFLSQTTENA